MSVVGQNIRKLREGLGDSQSAFAVRFGLNRGQIASYEAEEKASEPSMATVLAIVDNFNIDLRAFVSDPTFDGKVNGKVNGKPSPSDKTKRTNFKESKPQLAPQIQTEYLLATPDVNGNRLLPIVNRKAAANYLAGYETQEYFEELDAMTVPAWMLRGGGQGLVIQAVNDSMEDTIFDGDFMVCRFIDPAQWREITDFSVCVVVSENRGIQVKRVKNRLNKDGLLRLSSDNRHYPSFNIFHEDILQVWQVVFLVTANLPNRNDTLYRKMDTLEDTTTDLREMYEQLRVELDEVRGKKALKGRSNPV